MTTDAAGYRQEHGVLIQDVAAPATDVMRPLNGARTRGFPVYHDLEKLLREPGSDLADDGGPDEIVAHVLAVCAGYAYSDAGTVSLMMARMGLERNRVRLIAQSVDAMFIESSAFVVQSHDGSVVLVSYRGTRPTDLVKWLTDADVSPAKVRLDHQRTASLDAPAVHAGFYRNTRATRFLVTEALERARLGRSVVQPADGAEPEPVARPMERLYLTGHSLGGAMAALSTVLMTTEPAYMSTFEPLLGGVYTFGQPMVGDPALAELAARLPDLDDKLFRFVYRGDPVPHLPPQSTGPFRHVGREYRIRDGAWSRTRDPAGQMGSVAGLVLAGMSFVSRNVPYLGWVPYPYQLYDHGPQNYVAALTPADKVSEFGDYSYAEQVR